MENSVGLSETAKTELTGWDKAVAIQSAYDDEKTATKRCKRCGRVLPISNFRRNTRTDDGRVHSCFDCLRKEQIENGKKRKEAELAEAERIEELRCQFGSIKA